MNDSLFLLNRLPGNMTYLGILGLVFVAVSLAAGVAIFLGQRRLSLSSRKSRVLDPSGSSAVVEKPTCRLEDSSGFAKSISKPLHKLVAPSDSFSRKNIKLRLVQAGLRSNRDYLVFLAIKGFAALLFPLVYFCLAFTYRITAQLALISIILSACGFYLPDLGLLLLIRKRRQEMARALPDALDLMVVCTEAGLGVDQTFKRVGDEIRSVSRHLSDEFNLTSLEIQAGKSKIESYHNMVLRAGVPELSNLIAITTQSERFGTGIAKALRIHSDDMRVKRRQTAEERAAKLAVKLLFPLIFFIFPALFVVLLGPASIRIYQVLFPALQRGG
jgi:tight adherence protein C